jgi:SAM-dependent methyltransferase
MCEGSLGARSDFRIDLWCHGPGKLTPDHDRANRPKELSRTFGDPILAEVYSARASSRRPADLGAVVTELGIDVDRLFGEDYLYFYDESLQARTADEADVIWRLLDLEPGMELLDLACGHGRLANALAERGCVVTGLDAQPLFLEMARSDALARGVCVEYVQGDMRSLPWTGRFDRVINWFTAFGYFDDAGNQRVIGEVARALRPGGRFALETNNRDGVLLKFKPSSVHERDGNLLIDQHVYDPITGRMLTERTTIRDGHICRVPFFVRMCTFTELRDWLLRAGFTEVAGYGDYGSPLAADSRRMIAVALR